MPRRRPAGGLSVLAPLALGTAVGDANFACPALQMEWLADDQKGPGL